MNKRDDKTLVEGLKTRNLQRSMMQNQNLNSIDSNKNFTLATYFYNYLSGRSNKLPTYEYLNKILTEEINEGTFTLVSFGYGLSVFFEENETDKFFYIEYVEPINNSTSRIEKITPSLHEAYFANLVRIVPIDLNEFPIFKEVRVMALQKYLKEYSLNYIQTFNSLKR